MTDETRTFLYVALEFHGTPYRWGGDDPSGLDCSGLVVEAGQAAGMLARGKDMTADMLMRVCSPLERDELEPGDLVFWVKPREPGTLRAYHVGIVIDPPTHYLGAEGGGSTTKTLADAWRRNAYVKIRPIDSRGDETNRRYGRLRGD